MDEIRNVLVIRHLQRDDIEQAIPSAHIRDFDKMDYELQQTLARMAKAAARAMKNGTLGRMSPFYDVSYFQSPDETWADDDKEAVSMSPGALGVKVGE